MHTFKINNYGILAGGGKLPIIIYKSLVKNKKNVYLIGIKNNFNSNSKLKNFSEVKLGSLGKIIQILKKHNINKLIFAGSIKRPSIKDLALDFKAIQFINKYKPESFGDDKLLKVISKYFEKKGFKFVKWSHYCPQLFSNSNYLTYSRPSKTALENLNVGLKIFKLYSKLDIGQSMAVKNKLILGLEAAEGTDNLIKRCSRYKKSKEKGIIIKLKKYNQDLKFDLPTIGLNTIKLIIKYNYEGIFIQKKYCLILDKQKVIDFANKNNIFIAGIS